MDADFSAIYEEYYPKIYNYVYYRLLYRDDTEDIVSDVFFKALNGIHGFDGKRARVSTWLFRIAANAVNDYFRKLKTAAAVPLDDRLPALPDSALEEVIRAEELQRLRECLRTLDERTRSVITLRYWGEFSYAEIADMTGLSEKNVGVILSRGIDRLVKLFEKSV